MIPTMTKNEHLSVAWVSLGCPKNLVDSEKMLALLAQGGCVVGAPMDEADVIVVNTCGFLSSARDEAIEVIEEALEYKRTGPARRVVVAGCLVNRDGEKLYEMLSGIDAIVSVNDRRKILRAVTGSGQVSFFNSSPAKPASDRGRLRLTAPHTAYLRISEGCSHGCTFCTIPAIRGPFRSKSPRSVLAEARELADDSAAELNVIGQDTVGYGGDLNTDKPCDLPKLLRRIAAVDGIRWVRLMYAHPKNFSDELIDTLAGGGGIIPYVDLPLQHISSPILRKMGRRVKRSDLEKLLDKLRRRIDNLVIRTTFIVGFPGEGQAEFDELLRFVQDFRFDALGVFGFSPEEGTPAARLAGQVDDEEKARRVEKIMLAQQKIVFQSNSKMVGEEVELLVDSPDDEGRCVGRYFGQAPEIDSVCYLTEPRDAGEFVRCKIIASDEYDLIVKPLCKK